MVATSGAAASSSTNLGSCDRARSTNSVAESEPARSAAVIASRGGSDMGGTRYTRSPSMPSGSLEVARNLTRGQYRMTC